MRAPEFWTKDDLASRLLVRALTPVGWGYGAGVALRKALTYPLRTRAKIVCIGNLTAGGSGKTPVAIAVADALIAQGRKVVFLSRGYGGQARGAVLVDPERHDAREVGDEPLLLARTAPVVVSRDRRAGAKLAIASGADVVVMDDGHQNFQLAKDLSLIVADAHAPFGNGRMLPAGPLREPVAQGLSRADALILVGDGAGTPDATIPVLHVHVERKKPQELSGQRVLAFAGIGQPERFFRTLDGLGAVVTARRTFGDHHVYTSQEIAGLQASAHAQEARLVTTEKDFVRLDRNLRQDIEVLPVRALFDDERALTQLLSKL